MDGFGYSWDMTRSGQALLEHVPSPALLVDQGQVTFANAAARELLGAQLLGVYGQLQRAGEVVHLVAKRLVDLLPWLGRLTVRSRDFH